MSGKVLSAILMGFVVVILAFAVGARDTKHTKITPTGQVMLSRDAEQMPTLVEITDTGKWFSPDGDLLDIKADGDATVLVKGEKKEIQFGWYREAGRIIFMGWVGIDPKKGFESMICDGGEMILCNRGGVEGESEIWSRVKTN